MSLFKARDWWSITLGDKEEFDQGCLCLADIDNIGTGQDKIIVGSYMGYLRIFNPHPVKTGDSAQASRSVPARPNPAGGSRKVCLRYRSASFGCVAF